MKKRHYDEYKKRIEGLRTQNLEIVALALVGPDADIRKVTKKYSVFK